MARNNNNQSFVHNIDWLTVMLYAMSVVIGVFSIYAAIYNPDEQTKFFDFSNSAGKQSMYIGTSLLLGVAVLVIDNRFWEVFAPVIYGIILILLVLILFLGSNIGGSHSWFKIGTFGLQPAEFAKLGISLMLARHISQSNINLSRFKDQMYVAVIILIPAVLILLSNETGIVLVFASFLIVLYREGLPGIFPTVFLMAIFLFVLTLFYPQLYVILGVVALMVFGYYVIIPRYNRNRKTATLLSMVGGAMILYTLSVNFIFENVLQPHQQNRIKVLLDPNVDRRGIGWNVTQSKIAIGSGGLWGKGYLDGTQTKFDFVYAQHTDFIFCTIGEERGFVGSMAIIILFLVFLARIVFISERQRSTFGRIYGYCFAGALFFHFMVNIGMTIGMIPVIGITLPFFSYGGSSLWCFTIMLFILLKIDAQRPYTLAH